MNSLHSRARLRVKSSGSWFSPNQTPGNVRDKTEAAMPARSICDSNSAGFHVVKALAASVPWDATPFRTFSAITAAKRGMEKCEWISIQSRSGFGSTADHVRRDRDMPAVRAPRPVRNWRLGKYDEPEKIC